MTAREQLIKALRTEPTASQFLKIGDLYEQLMQERKAAADMLEADGVPVAALAWKGLTDVQWMNIVNLNHAWRGFTAEEAVHEVVKLTEARLKATNTAPQPAIQAERVPLTDGEIDKIIIQHLPDWNEWHDGPSLSEIRAIVRAANGIVENKP